MTDEKELMLQVKAGHLDKLAVLFESNKVSLFNFFLRMGNNRALSEDLVQETFMRVLAYRTSFHGDSAFRTWLYSIARNTAVDHYRKNKRNQGHMDIDEHEHEIESEQTLVGETIDKEKHKLFQQSLASLPAEQREIIVLSRFQQLNYQEIADMLDCNLNTLKARMRAAIGKLKTTYEQLAGERSC